MILFQTELCRAEKISSRLLAASPIMVNKMIDKDRLREIWKEIKMLDIWEIAREEGIEEGKSLGIEEGEALGMTKATREMLKGLPIEKYDVVQKRVFEKIEKIDDVVILKALFRKALRCDTVEKFEIILDSY